MTDARTLFVKVHIDTDTDRFAVWKDGLDWVECDLGPHLAAAAEADILRERVATLEGAARRVTSAQVYEVPGNPCKGLDVGFVRALRLLYEVVTSPAPTPATDEARCGHDPVAMGWDYWCIAPCHADGTCDGECDPDCNRCPDPCPLCQPTPEPACFLCRRTKDEHAARTDLLHTFTPEPK